MEGLGGESDSISDKPAAINNWGGKRDEKGPVVPEYFHQTKWKVKH